MILTLADSTLAASRRFLVCSSSCELLLLRFCAAVRWCGTLWWIVFCVSLLLARNIFFLHRLQSSFLCDVMILKIHSTKRKRIFIKYFFTPAIQSVLSALFCIVSLLGIAFFYAVDDGVWGKFKSFSRRSKKLAMKEVSLCLVVVKRFEIVFYFYFDGPRFFAAWWFVCSQTQKNRHFCLLCLLKVKFSHPICSERFIHEMIWSGVPTTSAQFSSYADKREHETCQLKTPKFAQLVLVNLLETSHSK